MVEGIAVAFGMLFYFGMALGMVLLVAILLQAIREDAKCYSPRSEGRARFSF